MSSPIYHDYHPRWLRRRMSTYWWLGKWPYVKFILRELSSVFVAWCVIFLLLLVRAIARGPEAYKSFLEFACHPAMLTLNTVALAFIVFHAVTWFALAPQAMVLHIGKKRVPGFMIAGANYGGWFAVSVALIGALIWL